MCHLLQVVSRGEHSRSTQTKTVWKSGVKRKQVRSRGKVSGWFGNTEGNKTQED